MRDVTSEPTPLLTATVLGDLNDEQRAAASHGNSALLIVAGAGTGKTTTLAHRVAHLIAAGADPGRVLLLTFTRRAASEMMRRVDALLRELAEQDASFTSRNLSGARLWGGTFHAVGARLLRMHARDVGLEPDFTVLDRVDSEDLMHACRTELGLGRGGSRFPQKSTCLDIYSRCVNSQKPLADVCKRQFPWCSREVDGLAQLFDAYTQAKEDQHVLDYDDILLFWHALLADEETGARVRERFDHVLVDEYQDTNVLQAEIVSGLRPDGSGVTAVGDDAQAIYSFRAATVRNILDFEERFGDATVMTLTRNYRSTSPILSATNAVIAEASGAAREGPVDSARWGWSALHRAVPRRGRADRLAGRAHPRPPRTGHAAEEAGGAVQGAAPFDASGDGTAAAQRPVHQVRRAQVHRDGPREGPARDPAARRQSPRRHRRAEGARPRYPGSARRRPPG